MAAGLPVIATDVGGNGEAVVDGVTGLLVAARDASTLADALTQLAGDEQRRRSMGHAGRRREEAHFTPEAMIDAYERLYRGFGC
jgi:glycosyltransferase involved in cell wall biosynthesis